MRTIVQVFFGGAPINIQGGTEKVFAQMSNLAVEKGYDVINIYNDPINQKPFFPINDKVQLCNLSLGKIKLPFYLKIIREVSRLLHCNTGYYQCLYRSKKLAKHIDDVLKNRDIYAIVCYETDAELRSIMAVNQIKHKVPKISMLHNSIDEHLKPLSKQWIREIDKMDAYQVLMPSFVEQAKKYLNTKIVCIPNIVPQVNIEHYTKNTKEKKIIITIGRIDKRHKQQHILVEAFAKIAHKFPDWEVHIYGPAQYENYKAEIENFIKLNNLSNQLFFKGVTKEPLEKLLNSDIFAFPSAFEGFPLALSEAMGCALPAVGFKDTPAVNELIKDGENGFLCKDTDDFADKLEVLMKDEELRKSMGAKAHEDMKEYSADKVWAKWEKLFEEVNDKRK
jgi:glycosyltransferase involved in cell wall biosynthesis